MKKRYSVTIDLYIWAKDDDAARRKAANVARAVSLRDDNQAAVIQIVERPFGIGQARSVELESKLEA